MVVIRYGDRKGPCPLLIEVMFKTKFSEPCHLGTEALLYSSIHMYVIHRYLPTYLSPWVCLTWRERPHHYYPNLHLPPSQNTYREKQMRDAVKYLCTVVSGYT